MRHSLAAALALTAAAPLAAQQAREPITFAGDVFDVTGAGTLDLGNIDPIMLPHIKDFEARPIMTEVELDLTVDPAGTVLDCRAAASDGLARAGEKLCVHAKAVGRFRADPFLKLDYTRANYRTSIRLRYYPDEGQSRFYPSSNEYPFLDDRPVIFGDGVVPPEDQSLAKTDVTIAPLDYPRQAARNAVMGRVEVSVTFDATGKPESCRPIRSDFTARLAYETCEAARRGVRLNSPPDARPFVMKVTWRLN